MPKPETFHDDDVFGHDVCVDCHQTFGRNKNCKRCNLLKQIKQEYRYAVRRAKEKAMNDIERVKTTQYLYDTLR